MNWPSAQTKASKTATIASSRFPGAKHIALSGLAALTGLFLCAGAALAQASGGQAAFDDKDFARAEELWQQEAAAGSAEAMFGLGLLRDLGLGRSRAPTAALQWYLEAANRGIAEAQLNTAVMLDSGIGLPRQPEAAAAWYGRAAANGNMRASYNLGLLFVAGDGVPQNADLARYWLRRADPELEAARERIETLKPPQQDERQMVAPIMLAGGIVDGEEPRAELVWAAPPGPEGASFEIELIARPSPDQATRQLYLSATQASAARIPVPDPDWQMAWRVLRRDREAGTYASSPWQIVSDHDLPPPKAVLRLRLARGDAAAEAFARQLVPVFGQAGIWVRIVQMDPQTFRPLATTVSYADPKDGQLAGFIADFMPGLSGEDAVLVQGPSARPGLLVLDLVGGPAGGD